MLTGNDKTWLLRSMVETASGMRVPLRADLEQFASELEGLLRPLVAEVVAMREELQSLKAGLADAATEIRKRDANQADDWWRGGEEQGRA